MTEKMKAESSLSERMALASERAFAALKSGSGVAPIIGMDEERCEAIYALGHRRYMRKDYEGAEEIFAWLAGIRGVDVRVLKALGAARKMRGKNKEALEAYAIAAVADLQDPEPSFYAAECLFRMGDTKRTRHALMAARGQAEALGRQEAMIAKIDEMLSHVPEMEGEGEGDAKDSDKKEIPHD